jgi:hypothetical protein
MEGGRHIDPMLQYCSTCLLEAFVYRYYPIISIGWWFFNLLIVSPAYGYVSLALVKHSNEGGPGPRYNMKEDPGSSTLTMLAVHAYHLYLMPLFSEAGDKRTRGMDLPPPPHQSNLGKALSRPLQVHTPPLAKMSVETRLSGNHTSAFD